MAGLSACTGEARPLTQVHVEGGRAAQRAVVEETASDFAAWMRSPDDVVLSAIEFADLPGALGAYHSKRRRVLLSEDLSPEEVPGVLRHELCHAWDHQAGWPSEQIDALDAMYHDLPVATVDQEGGSGDIHTQRRETLATLCEVGPLAVRGLLTPCGVVSADHSYVARFVLGTIWPNGTDWASAPSLGPALVTASFRPEWSDWCPTGVPLRSAGVSSGRSGHTVWASALDDAIGLLCWDGVWPADELGEQTSAVPARWDPPFPYAQPLAIGPNGVEAYSAMTPGNRSMYNVITVDGQHWSPVDSGHCVERTMPLFATTHLVVQAVKGPSMQTVTFHEVLPGASSP